MTEAPFPETLLSVLILTIPLAVFLLLIVLLMKRRSAKTKPAQGRPAQAVSLGVGQSAHALGAVGAAVAAAETPVPNEGAVDVKLRIAAAESSGAESEIALLYLELARAEAASGNEPARMAALRSAAGIGALNGPRSAHAQARIELAEAAYASGDLTSACEHWQIARMAYYEDGNTEAHAAIEKRMRDNGCPTDWVLTDF